MIVDYTAHAMIGVRFELVDLHRNIAVPGCEHAITLAGANFCPTCGKPTTISEYEPVYDERTEKLGELDVVLVSSRNYAIVGLLHCKTDKYDEPGMIKLATTNIIDMAELIGRTLQVHGLWRNQPIMLYCMLDASY
jgi:hypothetical protein